MSSYHSPVLLQPACASLNIISGGKYIDATLGGGGHTQEIVDKGGIVLGLDQDQESLIACPDLDQLTKVHTNFTHLKEVARQNNFVPCDGIIFDLGVSSHQIDTPQRGFSFQKEGPLDMRMDHESGVKADDLVNTLPAVELGHIFRVFGEVPGSLQIAENIVSHRPIKTTLELRKLTGSYYRQVFQALRIAVNDELGSLEIALPQALDCLRPGGNLVVITFHSLEDRIVKEQFHEFESEKKGVVVTADPITPDQEEITINPRSKSAKLRVFKKL